MKKIIYALILPLVVISGLVFANHDIKSETPKKANPKALTAAETENPIWMSAKKEEQFA